jgi:hypothetical protein
VISKIPLQLKGKRIRPGQAGVIVAYEAEHGIFQVAFCGILDPVAFQRNEIEPRLL